MLFIGWTADTTGNKIYTASDTAPTTVANVDINGDTTVYAAWGVDTNGDGVPDVNETGKYTLTYAENELESGTLQGSAHRQRHLCQGQYGCPGRWKRPQPHRNYNQRQGNGPFRGLVQDTD